jgi:hypothetical protein
MTVGIRAAEGDLGAGLSHDLPSKITDPVPENVRDW